MSEVRKCCNRTCPRPAAFLSALCDSCQTSHSKAVRKYYNKKRKPVWAVRRWQNIKRAPTV